MEKITGKELIDFRKMSQRSRQTLVNKIRTRVKQKSENLSGGDYWVSCLSTISNVFKVDNTNLLNQKIEQLEHKIQKTKIDRIKTQFRRNIDVLNNFQEFDFNLIKPNSDVHFLRKPVEDSIIEVIKHPIYSKPNHVYSFDKEVGAVWFIAKLGGLKIDELGLFADIQFRYLDVNFTSDYTLNPDYCIAVDVISGRKVSYQELLNGDVPFILEKTIEEIIQL